MSFRLGAAHTRSPPRVRLLVALRAHHGRHVHRQLDSDAGRHADRLADPVARGPGGPVDLLVRGDQRDGDIRTDTGTDRAGKGF